MTWAAFITAIQEDNFSGRSFSIPDLSRMTGISRETIYRIKAGELVDLHESIVSKIEDTFKIKINITDSNEIEYRSVGLDGISKSTLLNKDKTIVEALQSELNEARDLLKKILNRFFFLDHFYDERYSTFYLKCRVTDPVDLETSDILNDIESWLDWESFREEERKEILKRILSDAHVKKSLKIIVDSNNNNSKNTDEN